MKIRHILFVSSLSLLFILFLSGCIYEQSDDACRHYTLKDEIIKNSTCTTNGIKKQSCTKCDYTTEVEIPASHDFVGKETLVEATCTKDGLQLDVCSVCGLGMERPTSASHTFSGLNCIVCGYSKPFPELSIGMSKSTVRSKCGEPLEIDRNTSSSGTRETWWYKNNGNVISVHFDTYGDVSHITQT